MLSPDVLEARRMAETMEREIIFGMLSSYRFYRDLRDIVCPWDQDRMQHRLDFSTPRYNTLYRAIDAFYRRFDRLTAPSPTLRLPCRVLHNTLVDWANKNAVPASIADELLAEILEEEAFTDSLAYDSLRALSDGPAFKDWLKARVLEQTVGHIQSQKGLGALTFEKMDELVTKGREAAAKVSVNNEMARSISEFQIHPENDASILIGPGRFLCRDAICTVTGPSGIGKSTLITQLCIALACGREEFGFKPTKSLKILIIQGENDEGDVAEQRDGAIAGLQLNETEMNEVNQNVMVLRSNSMTGEEFIKLVVSPNLRQHQFDVLVIDPALAYLGGNAKEQEIVGEFLRTHLQKVLGEFNCACLLVHHTNKPPTHQGKVQWSGADSYLEGGSAEFRNVPRAAITLIPIGVTGMYELSVPKRGGRLGWKNEAGEPTIKKFIKQSTTNRLFWEPASEEDAEHAKIRQIKSAEEDILEKVFGCLPTTGAISQKDILTVAKSRGVADRKTREAIQALVSAGRIAPQERKRSNARPEIFYARVAPTMIPGGEVTNN